MSLYTVFLLLLLCYQCNFDIKIALLQQCIVGHTHNREEGKAYEREYIL